MSALPPIQMATMRDTAAEAERSIELLCESWDSIHERTDRIAGLAGLSPENRSTERAAFPVLLAEASSSQLAMVARAIEDIEAMIGVGLKALETVTARGQDAHAPALALWREFHHAREAMLLALLPKPKAA